MEYIIIILYLYGWLLMLLIGGLVDATPKNRIWQAIWLILIFFIWPLIITFGLFGRLFIKRKMLK